MVAVVIVGAVAYHHDDVPYVEDVEGGDAMMLLPYAGDVDGRQAGKDAVRHVRPAQGQAVRLGLSAQLR